MLFLIVVPQIYLIGSILVIISVTCLGSSFVILNSFLPLLVSNHPSIQTHGNHGTQYSSSIALETLSSGSRGLNPMGHDRQNTDTAVGSPLAELASPAVGSRLNSTSPELQLSNKISSKGVGLGYSAAVFIQCLCIILLFLLSKLSSPSSSPTFPLRLVLFLVGLCWFSFTIPSRLWLRNRPGPPLSSLVSRHGRNWRSCLDYIAFAWVSVWRTIKVAAKLRQVVIFLVAWFLLSDAIATVSGTAILFAKTELKMATAAIALLSVVATTSGILGAFTWPILSRRLGMKSNHTIIACIALFEIIPLYGLMGYLPFIKRWGIGGLQQAWEIYPLGFVHGFAMGGLSSYCRSFFGLLIPPGSEAAFYALYAITDKGSSAVGPSVVGAIVDSTGHMRAAFGFIAILTVLPAPLIWLVDAERGRRDGLKMAEAIKARKLGDSGSTTHVQESVEEAEGLLAHHD